MYIFKFYGAKRPGGGGETTRGETSRGGNGLRGETSRNRKVSPRHFEKLWTQYTLD